MPETLFHVLDAAEWAQARASGRHAPPALARDGFLHCCTRAQLGFVAARHFAGRGGMLAMRFRPELCAAAVEWVRSEPDQAPFPHLRGAVPLDAVVEVVALDALLAPVDDARPGGGPAAAVPDVAHLRGRRVGKDGRVEFRAGRGWWRRPLSEGGMILGAALLLAAQLGVFVLERQVAGRLGTAPGTAADPSTFTLLALGGLSRGPVRAGEWHRMPGMALLHVDAAHLCIDAAAFALSGCALERMVGRAWMSCMVSLGALAASAVSVVLGTSGVVSVGASGAIAAMVAALLVASHRMAPGLPKVRLQARAYWAMTGPCWRSWSRSGWEAPTSASTTARISAGRCWAARSACSCWPRGGTTVPCRASVPSPWASACCRRWRTLLAPHPYGLQPTLGNTIAACLAIALQQQGHAGEARTIAAPACAATGEDAPSTELRLALALWNLCGEASATRHGNVER